MALDHGRRTAAWPPSVIASWRICPAAATKRREARRLCGQGARHKVESATVHPIVADARHAAVIRATADLLTRLRLDHLFVGSVARAAHSGQPIESGSI